MGTVRRPSFAHVKEIVYFIFVTRCPVREKWSIYLSEVFLLGENVFVLSKYLYDKPVDFLKFISKDKNGRCILSQKFLHREGWGTYLAHTKHLYDKPVVFSFFVKLT